MLIKILKEVLGKRRIQESAIPDFKGVMYLLKNTEKAPNMGSRFAQDVEPSGFYAVEFTRYSEDLLSLPNYKKYEVTIRNPLVVPVDSSSLVQWKRDLSAKYKAKGKSLTSKLIKAGYDAIVTWNTEYNEAGEIVILNTSTLKQV